MSIAFFMKKEQKQQVKSPATVPEPASDKTLPLKLTLKEYKSKLDFTLGYYSEFSMIIYAIVIPKEKMLLDTISNIKRKKDEALLNENLLTEQVHFDLSDKDINLFYKYGLKKIDEIMNWFNLSSVPLVNYFNDDSLNKLIHKLWYSTAGFGALPFIHKSEPEGFIEFLYEMLKYEIAEFKDKFIKSYSLFSDTNELSLTQYQNQNEVSIAKIQAPTEIVNVDVSEYRSRIKAALNEHLEQFKPEFQSDVDYNIVVEVLLSYFENKEFQISKPIFMKKGNKVKLASELGCLYQEFRSEAISVEYLQLLIQLFSLFKNETISSKALVSSKLYKYVTSKSQYL